MRLRVTWADHIKPYGALMLMSASDLRKVETWVDDTRTPRDKIVIDVDQVRSDPDHAHYFACIKVAYDNLPEDMHNDFLSPEHLRKWALVKAGWCTKTITVAKSNAEARRCAAMLQEYDEFVVALVEKRVVTAHKAVSQSYDDMSKSTFRKSKDDVLAILSTLIGTSVDELLRSTPRGQAEHSRSDRAAAVHDRGDQEILREPGELPEHETE